MSISDLAKEILSAILHAEPRVWTTWDSFAGRQIRHQQKVVDAQEEAVFEVLKKYLDDPLPGG